jgi:hypothetical protein
MMFWFRIVYDLEKERMTLAQTRSISPFSYTIRLSAY